MKIGFLKFGFCKFVIASFIVIGLMAGEGFGQDLDIFSGRGIGSSLQREIQDAQRNRSSTPSINNFSNDLAPSAVRKPFSGLFKKPKLPTWDGFKQKQAGEMLDRPNPLADLIPKRDASRPNFFQMMNTKSKSFLDKTKGWARNKGGGARDKTNETWDNVIRDFKASEAKFREQATIPAQPKFRTAEGIGEPKLRF